MKKLSLLIVMTGLMLLAHNTTQAQSYKNAIGLRALWGYGITFKHFLNEKAALEGVIYYRNYGYYAGDYNYFRITGLYLIHNQISSAPGLTWYYGGGLMFQSWGGKFKEFQPNASTTNFGIMGALGLDYKFANVPINLSLDWLPTIIIGGYLSGFGGEAGGFAIRYTF